MTDEPRQDDADGQVELDGGARMAVPAPAAPVVLPDPLIAVPVLNQEPPAEPVPAAAPALEEDPAPAPPPSLALEPPPGEPLPAEPATAADPPPAPPPPVTPEVAPPPVPAPAPPPAADPIAPPEPAVAPEPPAPEPPAPAAPAVAFEPPVPEPPAPAEPPAPVAGPARFEPARGGRARRAVAALLGIALLAAAVVGWVRYDAANDELRAARAATDRREEALSAARGFAATLTSYDYRRIEQDVKRVADQAGGEFKAEYAKASGTAFQQLVKTNKATSTGKVVSAGVVGDDGTTVTVLLAVDQTVTNANRRTPRTDRNRIQLALQRVDGRWLVVGVSVL